MNEPLGDGAEINPLDLPGSLRAKRKSVAPDSLGSAFVAGDYVETSVPNAPFFSKFPGTGAAPTKVLAQGMVLRVVASEGAYLKIQNESGEEGYIANVMVVPQGLLVGGAPLPDLPPVGPGEVPAVPMEDAPEPEISGLEPPISVDPSAPAPPVAPPIPADPDAPAVDKPADGAPKVEDPSVAPEPEIPGVEQ